MNRNRPESREGTRLSSARRRRGLIVLAIAVVLPAAVLMGVSVKDAAADSDPTCPSCLSVWSGILSSYAYTEHQVAVLEGEEYHSHMFPDTAGSSLTVAGDVSNVSCFNSGSNKVCNFDGKENGYADIKVTAGSAGMKYDLHFDYAN